MTIEETITKAVAFELERLAQGDTADNYEPSAEYLEPARRFIKRLDGAGFEVVAASAFKTNAFQLAQSRSRAGALAAAARRLMKWAAVEWMEHTTVGVGAPEPQPIRDMRAALEGHPDSGWLPMADAEKNFTPVLGLLRDDIKEANGDPYRCAGLMLVVRHPGLSKSGFDPGWSLAGPFGFGGLPDYWFVGWRPLPPKEGRQS